MNVKWRIYKSLQKTPPSSKFCKYTSGFSIKTSVWGFTERNVWSTEKSYRTSGHFNLNHHFIKWSNTEPGLRLNRWWFLWRYTMREWVPEKCGKCAYRKVSFVRAPSVPDPSWLPNILLTQWAILASLYCPTTLSLQLQRYSFVTIDLIGLVFTNDQPV